MVVEHLQKLVPVITYIYSSYKQSFPQQCLFFLSLEVKEGEKSKTRFTGLPLTVTKCCHWRLLLKMLDKCLLSSYSKHQKSNTQSMVCCMCGVLCSVYSRDFFCVHWDRSVSISDCIWFECTHFSCSDSSFNIMSQKRREKSKQERSGYKCWVSTMLNTLSASSPDHNDRVERELSREIWPFCSS